MIPRVVTARPFAQPGHVLVSTIFLSLGSRVVSSLELLLVGPQVETTGARFSWAWTWG